MLQLPQLQEYGISQQCIATLMFLPAPLIYNPANSGERRPNVYQTSAALANSLFRQKAEILVVICVRFWPQQRWHYCCPNLQQVSSPHAAFTPTAFLLLSLPRHLLARCLRKLTSSLCVACSCPAGSAAKPLVVPLLGGLVVGVMRVTTQSVTRSQGNSTQMLAVQSARWVEPMRSLTPG